MVLLQKANLPTINRGRLAKIKVSAFVFILALICMPPTMVSAEEEHRILIINRNGQLYFSIFEGSSMDNIDILDNFYVFPGSQNHFYNPVSHNINLDDPISSIRLFLLRRGYVDLINDDFATEYEIALRDTARESRAGHWDIILTPPTTPAPETTPIPTTTPTPTPTPEPEQSWFDNFLDGASSVFSAIGTFFANIWENWGTQIVWFLITGGAIASIAKFLRHKYKNKDLVLILWGNRASGKTEMFNRLHRRASSSGIEYNPTKTLVPEKVKEPVIVQSDPLIVAHLLAYDAGGNDLSSAVNAIKSRRFNRKKIVYIYMLSPVRENKGSIDKEYVEQQLERLTTMLNIFLRVNDMASKKPKKVILFLNKADIMGKEADVLLRKLFAPHIKEAENIDSKIKVEVVVGSASKDVGIDLIRESIGKTFARR